MKTNSVRGNNQEKDEAPLLLSILGRRAMVWCCTILLGCFLQDAHASGTVQVRATLNGKPWSGQLYFFADQFGGGISVPADYRDQPAGEYSLRLGTPPGGPANADLADVSPGPSQILADGGTITFSFNFVSKPGFTPGEIQINVTLDGKPWTPTDYPSNLVFQLTGATNRFGFQPFVPEPADDRTGNYPRNQNVQNVPAGDYKVTFQSLGPQEAILHDISPSDTQTLVGGSTIFFTFNFRSIQDSSTSGPLENWQVRNPLPQGNTLRGVAFGNGTFVAVGQDVILNSDNGNDWAVVPKATNSLSYSFYRVTFGDGRFVAVGNGSRRLSNLSYELGAVIGQSRDGRVWDIRLFPSEVRGIVRYLFGVAHDDKGFVAVGGTVNDYGSGVQIGDSFPYVPKPRFGPAPITKSFVMTSSDGITWNTAELPSSYWLYSVASGNNSFVAEGDGYALVKSTDGKAWTETTPQAPGLVSSASSTRIAYFGDHWMHVGCEFGGITGISSRGYIGASSDAQTWFGRSPQLPTSIPALFGVTRQSGRYIAVGSGGTIFTSTNNPFPVGLTMNWVKQAATTEENLWDVIFAKGTYVAVGANGTLLTSSSGTEWTVRSSGPTITLSSIAKAGSKLVAVGGFIPRYLQYRSTIVLSENDGLSWTPVGPTIPIPLSRVIYANGMFVASGSGSVNVTITNASGAVFGTQVTTNLVLISSNGKDWIDDAGRIDKWPSKIAQGNGALVGIRGRNLLTSANGTDWKVTTVISTNEFDSLSDIAFGNGTFVATGYGHIWTSSDGLSWEKQQRVNQGVGRLAFGAGVFVMVGAEAQGLFTSVDGKSWMLRGQSFEFSGISINELTLTYGNGMFLVTGLGSHLTSSDGLNWTRHMVDAIRGISDLIEIGDTFVAVGSGGKILQSGYLSGAVPQDVAAIYGKVLGPDGAILSGALVQTLRDGVVVTSAITDVGGQFRLRDLPADNYLVRASKGDLLPDTKNIITSQNGAVQLDFMVHFENVSVIGPQDRTVEAGASATFTVTATGSAPLQYQWLFNGIAMPRETNVTVTLSNVQSVQEGRYSVTVSNSAGSVTSREAILTVGSGRPPVITAQPQSQTVRAGVSASFSVEAAGTAPLNYQWRFNDVNIAGATNAVFTVANVQTGDSGTYTVQVSNASGSVASQAATLTVVAGLPFPARNSRAGTVVVWGAYALPYIEPGTRLRAISAGRYHSLALKQDGTVLAWGSNTENFGTFRGQATVPSGLSNVVAVAAGDFHSLALKEDGTVVAWGSGSAETVPIGLSNVVAIAAGATHNLALKQDGTVVDFGEISQGSVPGGLRNVVAIAAGDMHSLALRRDGTVIAWGDDSIGQRMVPSGLSNVVAIAAGWGHSLALKQDGTVVAWGFDRGARVPDGLRNVVAIAARGENSLVLKQDGTVVAWGDDASGQTSVPGGLRDVVAIAAGGMHSLALKQDATVVAWGANDQFGTFTGQASVPGSLSDVMAIATGGYHSLGLKQDGSVIAWGRNTGAGAAGQFTGQARVPGSLSNAVAVAAGGYHSLALKQNGTVVAWGDDASGQASVPDGLIGVAAIAAGERHSLALKYDGSVVVWGSGNGAVMPVGLSNVVAIAAGASHNLALREDGMVVAWGFNGNGQARVPVGLSNVVAIAAGDYHSLALKKNGTVVAWGNTAAVPSGLSNVVAVTGGRGTAGGYSLALKDDGTVVAWGSSIGTRVPTGLSNVVAVAAGSGYSMAIVSNSLSLTNLTIGNLQNQTVDVGGTASFAVTVIGSGPFFYQWLLNGAAIPGQTNSTITLTNVQVAQAGRYSVTVGNVAVSVTGREATLTVRVPSDTPPRFLGVQRVGAGIVLKVSTVVGLTYILETKTSLDEPQWTQLASFVAERTETEFPDANVSSGQKFYRLRVRQAE